MARCRAGPGGKIAHSRERGIAPVPAEQGATPFSEKDFFGAEKKTQINFLLLLDGPHDGKNLSERHPTLAWRGLSDREKYQQKKKKGRDRLSKETFSPLTGIPLRGIGAGKKSRKSPLPSVGKGQRRIQGCVTLSGKGLLHPSQEQIV